MKKLWKLVSKDLWILLLDIISVNAAYFLALMIRFYVNFRFLPSISYYLTDFKTFTPYYTVIAIIIFAAFRMYGGMWAYAGLNDMNRIILANICTSVVHIIGTALFVRRMPITYYCIGGALQFLFVVITRFGYRILMVEKKKIVSRRNPNVPCMVIGAGETARKAIHRLEETPFRAVVAVDEKSAGKTIDGIPIKDDYAKALSTVQAVFIADPGLSAEKKNEIREQCAAKGVEFWDYTGYLSNLGGRIPVSSLLELSCGKVSLIIDNKETEYKNGEEAIRSMKERYDVKCIKGMRIELTKPSNTAYAGYEAWAEQHKEQTGEDVSFF